MTPTAKADTPQFEPVTLEGRIVRLRPMCAADASPLWEASADGREETFRWFPWPVQTLAGL